MRNDRKIGVFICHCGGNISDYVDVDKVRKVVEADASVKVAKTNMFTCSDAAQQDMIEAIKEEGLDGIVIASCSPKLHLNTFRSMAERAGLNPYQYVQVNIREQCSWTHTHDREGATDKAIRLVRAGIAQAKLSQSLEKIRVETVPHVLIIGAGVSGLRAALALSEMGISVHVIERESQVGGRIRKWGKLFPGGETGRSMVDSLVRGVEERENIALFTGAELIEKKGSIGDFKVKVRLDDGSTSTITVGSIIVTTGAGSYVPQEGELGYGSTGVLTLEDLMNLLAKSGEELKYNGGKIRSIAYIYCVGSRQHGEDENLHKYCSRYCCTGAVHAANVVSEIDPSVLQFHLYRDIRTYGKFELLYEQALDRRSVFLRFDEEEPPIVERDSAGLLVSIKDKLTGGEEVRIRPDLVVLVTGLVPRPNKELASVLKLPVGKDGFFNEIHPKLRPVETVIDGIFIAGSAQAPRTLAESVTSSMAAVSKAASLLLKGYVDLEPLVAKVNVERCVWCGECARVCPYEAIRMVTTDGKEVAEVDSVLCKGEGACVPVCPREAIDVEGYTGEQIQSMIDALLQEVK